MQHSNKNALKLKDKLNDNELDLSMSELTKVPVKEMAAIPRATNVDLSNNKLVTLPLNFATLIHIVKLDLSKNKLKELPSNFGELHRLRHLDLYSNQLERLPVSFHQLKDLKWLDLKNNPLVPSLAEAVGDCLDAKACQQAAKNVIKLMTVVNNEIEAKKYKQMEEEKIKQAELLAKEAAEKERERQEKKAAKEKRKAEALRNYQESIQANAKKNSNKVKQTNSTSQKSQKPRSKSAAEGSSFCSKLFRCIITLFIMTLLIAAVLTALHWEGPLALSNLEPATNKAWKTTLKYTLEAKEWASPMVERFQNQLQKLGLFIAENSGDVGQVVWKKAKYYSVIILQQSAVIWDVVKERSVEIMAFSSKHVAHYWQILCNEFPIYQEIVMEKLRGIFSSIGSQGKQ